MGYVNIFQKLDKDIAEQLQELQTQQKELLEKKKSLLSTKQEIQNFLNSAQEVKKLVESEPDLLKSLRTELGQIFAMHHSPKLPRKKAENTTANLEKKPSPSSSPIKSINLEEESIDDFNFVDAQGKNKSMTSE